MGVTAAAELAQITPRTRLKFRESTLRENQTVPALWVVGWGAPGPVGLLRGGDLRVEEEADFSLEQKTSNSGKS